MNTSEPTPAALLAVAREAARAAREIALHYFRTEVRVEMKADQSPVTVADKEAEAAIISVIRSHFPDHSFLGEESGQTGPSGGQKKAFTWIIDPIDGTKNFIRQIPLFGTEIAVMAGDEIIAGVSLLPAMDELLSAAKGHGAFLNDLPIRVSTTGELSSAAISYYGYEKDVRWDRVAALSRNVAYVRGFGDCYSYHLVASGRIDAAFEPRIRIWDIAPFAVIIPEAGGMVTDEAGEPIGLTTRSIVASNGKLHPDMLRTLSK